MNKLIMISIAISCLIITTQANSIDNKGVNTPPTIVSISPVNNATNVSSNTNIVITFDEDVSLGLDEMTPLTDNSIIIDCNISGVQSYPPAEIFGITIVDINTNDFVVGDVCTVIVSAFWIHDIDDLSHFDGNGDGFSSPVDDDYVSIFTVGNGIGDSPPQVSMVTPTDMSNDVFPDTLIELVFNEPVDIPVDAITINCAESGVQSFPAVLTTPVTSINFDPVDFTNGESCSITASTLLIHDIDGFPDHLDGDGIANGDNFESFFTISSSTTLFSDGFEQVQ